MMVSYLLKIVGFRKQGDDLRKYVNLGIAKQFLNKYNPECLSIFDKRLAISSRFSSLASRTASMPFVHQFYTGGNPTK